MNEVNAMKMLRTIEHHARQLSELVAALGAELVGRPYKLHPNAVLDENELVEISEEEETPLHDEQSEASGQAGDPSQARADRTTDDAAQGGDQHKGRKRK